VKVRARVRRRWDDTTTRSRLAVSKELTKTRAHFSHFRPSNLSEGVENHTLLDGEKSLWANEAWLSQLPALEIGGIQRNGGLIRSRTGGDLTKDQVVTRKIDKDQRRSTLPDSKISLRKRNDDDFAGYRFAHAASSSGEFQSRARTDSLSSAPLNGSSPFLFRRTVKS